jgi:hypothetical protein
LVVSGKKLVVAFNVRFKSVQFRMLRDNFTNIF